MVDRIEDLNLPNTAIARLIQEAMPEDANITKEARIAIAKAAAVFAIFVTSTATSIADKQSHKSMTAQDLLESLRELDFESFIPPLTADLAVHRKVIKEKKESKASNKKD